MRIRRVSPPHLSDVALGDVLDNECHRLEPPAPVGVVGTFRPVTGWIGSTPVLVCPADHDYFTKVMSEVVGSTNAEAGAFADH